MKNISILTISLLFVVGLTIMSCNDWAEVEYVTIKEPGITDQSPELYAKYLANLREYKKTEHKQVYVWYDNSEKVPYNRVQHPTNLPDSIDVVSLMYPDKLVEQEISELETIRKDKGIKVIYTIDFNAIKDQYNLKHALTRGNEPVAVDFISFMVDTMQHALSLVEKYNYDGLCLGYMGKDALHMTIAEKQEYTANENVFIGILNDWHQRHTDKFIAFSGKPQHVINKKLLEDCKLIIVSCLDVKNKNEFTLNTEMAMVANVPAERFAISVSTPPSDKEDKEVGYFADGTLSLAGVPEWCVLTHNGFTVAGIAIYNVNNDYYNPSYTFKYTKDIINALNPTIKY